jgi:hypothetical protein
MPMRMKSWVRRTTVKGSGRIGQFSVKHACNLEIALLAAALTIRRITANSTTVAPPSGAITLPRRSSRRAGNAVALGEYPRLRMRWAYYISVEL